VLVCLALPVTATAARVELRPGAVPGQNELAYTAGADEVNSVSLYRQTGQPGGSVWVVNDVEGPPTERVPPCQSWSQGGPLSSACLDDHVASIVIDLGDRDDFAPVDAGFSLIYIPVTVYGGPGNDHIWMHSDGGNVLDGGPGNDVITSERWDGFNPNWPGGADTINGGDGNDEIHTQDQKRDVISCGAGVDEVFADNLDVVGADCEVVHRLGSPQPPDDVWLRSDGRPVGVTINGTAPYTNNPNVTLTVLRPPSATALRISNDGGFSRWYTTPPNRTERYRFRLESSGPERLPKTVYVRFDGPLDQTRTFTDDIVLDQRPPRVLGARRLDRTGGACAARRGCVRITLKARDSTSGVAAAQFARVRRHPWVSIAFHQRLALRHAPSWVRVRDRAGNVSRWSRVTGG
jgi:hypothetical protein